MPAAARVGDMTGHGTPLGPSPGSPNVWIGARPAWRALADVHACLLYSGSPHVGGVVTQGSTSVYINNLPAVRQGDMIQENGPPNPVVAGDFTVIIG